MRSVLVAALLWIVAFPAVAATGIVRGGEHGDFTRVTVEFDADVGAARQRQLDDRRFALDLNAEVTAVDVSQMFTRLNSGRAKMLSAAEGRITLELACDCRIDTTQSTARLLVIDIFDEPANADPSSAVSESPPVAMSTFPTGFEEPVILKPARLSLDLDYSVVQRVAQNLAEQISRSAFAVPSTYVLPAQTADLQETAGREERVHLKQTPNDDAGCTDLDILWRAIQKAQDTGPVPEQPAPAVPPYMETDDPAGQIADLLSAGLFAEAEALVRSPSGPYQTRFAGIVSLLMGKVAASDVGLDWSCNPFADLLHVYSADIGVGDLTGEQVLTLYTVFMALPVGLKIQLFDRLEPFVTQVSQAGVQSLVELRDQEHSLLASASEAAEGVQRGVPDRLDADAVGAIATELRGTRFEADSLTASFAAYLADKRYFDALSLLEKSTTLSKDHRENLLSRLMLDAAEHASPVTFLELVFGGQHVDLTALDADAASRTLARLSEEGFPEKAVQLYEAHGSNWPDPYLDLAVTHSDLRANRPDRAIEVFDKLPPGAADDPRTAAFALPGADADMTTAGPETLNVMEPDVPRPTTERDPLPEPLPAVVGESPAGLERLPEQVITVATAMERLEAAQSLRARLTELLPGD